MKLFGNQRMLKLLVALAAVVAGTLLVCDAVVSRSAQGRCFNHVQQLPKCTTAVLLGTSIRGRFTPANPYFGPRIEGVMALWRAGTIEQVFITGDSSSLSYNEPRWMADSLVASGLPPEIITLDFHGSHTQESAAHAAAFCHGKPCIVVSQQFHNERFIYLARRQGLEVWGLNCGNYMHRGLLQLRQRLREALSRAKAVLGCNHAKIAVF